MCNICYLSPAKETLHGTKKLIPGLFMNKPRPRFCPLNFISFSLTLGLFSNMHDSIWTLCCQLANQKGHQPQALPPFSPAEIKFNVKSSIFKQIESVF